MSEWCRAAWGNRVPKRDMEQAWEESVPRRGFGKVKPTGPAAALVDIAHRMNWTMRGPWVFVGANENVLDLSNEELKLAAHRHDDSPRQLDDSLNWKRNFVYE